MHIHRLEKIWLTFGMAMLAVFLLILGLSAFTMGMDTPNSGHDHSVHAAKLSETPPFDHPAITQIGDREYEAVMTAWAFGYSPDQDQLVVPAGSTVHFSVTSSDVVHGFEIPGTNVNMMVLPGEVNHVSHKFDEPGEYLILCNEYCGIGHQAMFTKLIVT
ncbi:cytochrome c oxidase subunit II [Cohnella lubricantis]|uniref:Cytochrome aa3 subunit 2 n=1 Tax=Cohnella lubricantis TaxID=2163172 RepID=A0A841T9K6_9BACL|nr:cytochrome c oxidase subunit II [Cohnella lubricantis]MBB6676705.1 cytochrome C oxidase subunit II [Cohnella lubricantis]